MMITVGGKEYTVRPDFATIEKIEQRFDIMTFMSTIMSQRPKLSQIAWVLYSAIVVYGHEVKYEDIGNAVIEDVEGCSVTAAELLSEMVSASPEKTGKKKAEEKEDIQK